MSILWLTENMQLQAWAKEMEERLHARKALRPQRRVSAKLGWERRRGEK